MFDTRVAKAFKFGENCSLSFLAEAFNLFNRSNIDMGQFAVPIASRKKVLEMRFVASNKKVLEMVCEK